MQIPSSTYRIQLHAGFTFRQLEGILEYLHELGISTVYASPITQAVKGSMHGYDAIDPLSINREIGTEEELERLAARLKQYQMGWLQDIVPNHMAFDSSNPWLFDVLEKGEGSPYHRFFDIDWDHPDAELNHKLMAPFLGDSREACLQKGEIRLESSDKGWRIRYVDSLYPVSPSSYSYIRGKIGEEIGGKIRNESGEQITKDFAKKIGDVFAEGIGERPQLPEELLDLQHYALTDSRLAATKINYRRFFTVNSLICLRMEDEIVFERYHAAIRSWYEKGYIQGLRIDHIDGLADPAGYIRRLKDLFGKDCYTVAEKILQADEPLPDDWQLEGTTGYEFLFLVNQLMTEQAGCRKILEFYKQLVPATPRYEDLQYIKKYDFLKKHMAGELDNLAEQLVDTLLLSEEQQDERDEEGRPKLKEALAVLMASFPVYRIYPGASPLPESSRLILDAAFTRARQKDPFLGSALDRLQEILEGRGDKGTGDPEKNQRNLAFRIRLMQFTGPLAAKGIEDTAFYTYDPLLSHNEVGDTPGIQGIGIEEFHQKMMERQAKLPLSLNATATHDTKRGEDTRIRLDLLTTLPDEWMAAVNTWRSINHALIKEVHGHPAPSPNDEYFIYQSLLGGLPMDMIINDSFRGRFRQFLTKALREAKTETNWEEPDEQYEKSCQAFTDSILGRNSGFLKAFTPFAGEIIEKASVYSLSQLLIKLTAPGIPDIYQGAELWDLSFVDPDNRRPVNYEHRKHLLKEIAEHERKGIMTLLEFLSSNKGSGVEKLFIIQKTLAYRNRHPLLFTEGDYLPVRVHPHWIAYLRRHEQHWLLVIVPLIRKEWENVKHIGILTLDLPANAPTRWKNEFTGQVFRGEAMPMTTEVFAGFPVTLLSGTN